MSADPRPIGIFDSGVGGLTVLRAIRELMPAESLIYLGDTARVPYGTKSPASVERYAARVAQHLAERGIKLLVVACNTASAVALDTLRAGFAPIPVIGVVEPGAAAAVATSRSQRFAVLATESTVARRQYTETIQRASPGALVEEIPCSLFVALAEEGWSGGEVAEAAARRYLGGFAARAPAERPDCVILGCTHFPLLRPAISQVVAQGTVIVDSASTTAGVAASRLAEHDLLNDQQGPGRLRLMATDGASRFARVGGRFIGEALDADDVELVDL